MSDKKKITFISPYVYAGIKTINIPQEFKITMKNLRNNYTQDIILNAINVVTGVTFRNICSRRRDRPIVYARKMYSFFTKEKLGWTYKEIGISMGGRDHTTAIHAVDTYHDLYLTLDDFKDTSDRVLSLIESNSATHF
jgi:chromosomal replication initiator protein